VARHIFQAFPVWIYTQSNITQASHFIKFPEIFIHFLWKSQFQVFDHFWSLPFYLWLVSCTNNKGDWCIQTIQQGVYNYTRKCMNISRNLIKLIGQPKVMYWINIWGTIQLERQ
jgi:hypothetical protein